MASTEFAREERKRRSKEPEGMEFDDPIDLLKSQHREVEQLFQQIEDTGSNAFKTKRKLFETLADQILLHAEIEEKLFYPRIKEVDKDMALEAVEEHAAVKDLIKKMRKLEDRDESFNAKVKFLKELIQHHVEEEEEEIFPMWYDEMDEETQEDAGTEILEYARKAMEKSKNQRGK
ncbi:MAG: hemerythrin domain-containing protein [Oligoflexales bacterium]